MDEMPSLSPGDDAQRNHRTSPYRIDPDESLQEIAAKWHTGILPAGGPLNDESREYEKHDHSFLAEAEGHAPGQGHRIVMEHVRQAHIQSCKTANCLEPLKFHRFTMFGRCHRRRHLGRRRREARLG